MSLSGRLVRVRSHPGDYQPLLYVVATGEPEQAVDIVASALSRPREDVEDLGPINETLLATLNLNPGQYARSAGRYVLRDDRVIVAVARLQRKTPAVHPGRGFPISVLLKAITTLSMKTAHSYRGRSKKF
jgi:hypothetical protein